MGDLAFIITLGGWVGVIVMVIISKGWRWKRAVGTLAIIWIVGKCLMLLSGHGLVRELDVTRPSLFGIVGVCSVIAYIVMSLSSRKPPEQHSDRQGT